MRLNHGDWERVSVFLQNLYAQRGIDAFRQAVLDGLSKLIPCEHISYNEINSRTNALVCLMRPWVPEVIALAPLLEANFSQHPQLQYYPRSADRRVYQTTDFFSLRQFHNRAIYQEFYRHVGTEHQLPCVLSEQGAVEDTGIGLNRKLKKFSERDRAVLDHLHPHLIRARQNAIAIATSEERVHSLTSTLDTVQAGLALVDCAGRVTWATPCVVRWLELYFPNSRGHGDRLPDDLERWLRAQLSALGKGTDIATAFVAHHEHSTLTVRFQPVTNGAIRLVFSEQCEPMAEDRGRTFGLTQRETEILHWTREGKNSPEIAVILQISPRTVHKHMEHVLAKLGVETRLAAARLVAA